MMPTEYQRMVMHLHSVRITLNLFIHMKNSLYYEFYIFFPTFLFYLLETTRLYFCRSYLESSVLPFIAIIFLT